MTTVFTPIVRNKLRAMMPRNTVYVPFPLSPHKKASEDFIDSIEKLY